MVISDQCSSYKDLRGLTSLLLLLGHSSVLGLEQEDHPGVYLICGIAKVTVKLSINV